jgi:hypothetical protein
MRSGMDPSHVAQLQSLRLPDLRVLAASEEPIVSLAIDTEALGESLKSLAERDEVLQLRDEFIRQGASPKLMRTLFSLPAKSTLQRRREFNVPRRRGRPRLPNRLERDAIEARWRHSPEQDLRRRFLALHAAFPQFSLDAIGTVVTAYEAMGVEARPVVRAKG